MQPAQHRCQACCLPTTESISYQSVVGNTLGTRTSGSHTSFPKVVTRHSLVTSLIMKYWTQGRTQTNCRLTASSNERTARARAGSRSGWELEASDPEASSQGTSGLGSSGEAIAPERANSPYAFWNESNCKFSLFPHAGRSWGWSERWRRELGKILRKTTAVFFNVRNVG